MMVVRYSFFSSLLLLLTTPILRKETRLSTSKTKKQSKSVKFLEEGKNVARAVPAVFPDVSCGCWSFVLEFSQYFLMYLACGCWHSCRSLYNRCNAITIKVANAVASGNYALDQTHILYSHFPFFS